MKLTYHFPSLDTISQALSCSACGASEFSLTDGVMQCERCLHYPTREEIQRMRGTLAKCVLVTDDESGETVFGKNIGCQACGGATEFTMVCDEIQSGRCTRCGHTLTRGEIEQALTTTETSHDAQGCSPVLNQPKGR